MRRVGTAARATVLLVISAVLGALLIALPTPALAAGSVLFQNSFANNTVNGTGTVSMPPPAVGTNAACLTASGNTTSGPLLSCPGTTDGAGTGKLRLTNSSTNQVGGVFGATSFPTSSGLDVTFNSYQWGGGGADGLAFMLAAVDPANPATPTTIGPNGGSLGYSRAGGVSGLPNAYLGVGLDVFGNFSSTGFQGTGCTNVLNITSPTPGAAVVRGPGKGTVGYCGLATTFTAEGKIALRAATRAASVVPVQVLVNPSSAAFTSDSGVSVAAGTYKVVLTPVGQTAKTLTGPLPQVAAGLYPSTTWLNAAGVPKQLAFAFVGSTGSVTDAHEISDVKVLTFDPVPQLTVDTTSYSAAAPAPGAPVNYRVVAGVSSSGPAVTTPVSVTQTVPVGMVPAVAYGAGWVCQAPVARTVTCTTTASSFASGSTLPALTVVGIVTGASMTSALVQSGSPSLASSADGNSGTDLATTAGTVSAAPTGMSVAPTIGPIAGGGDVGGIASTSTAPTAIMVGTVAEQQAGAPVVLVPCVGSQATGCFTFTPGSPDTYDIPSMPGRAGAAATRITVVTLGAAASVGYTYADRPATMVTPTATAGTTSTALTWVAPASNESPITGYVITPYLNGTAQPTQTSAAGTTTKSFTGLAAGTSWTYTVSAVNAYGTSTASPRSTAVIPYSLPGAPTVSALSARNSAVQLTWTAPAANGSTITGYVVTPYLGAVAQPVRTFGPATTQIVTGLSAGTAYTFTVAAQNAAGTGPASAQTTAVTPNSSPSLPFPAPPAGEVGVPYSQQLTVAFGTSPFVWSVSSGALPAGLALNASTGLLAGTPTASGSFALTVQVLDASGETATRAVTLVMAATPVVTFAPAAGEVGVGYSQQPTLTGGTAPFAWAVSSGSLPAGLTLSATTGLVSGTPTASGIFSVVVSATDAFDQVANRAASLVIAAQPTFAAGTPPQAQVGVAYATSFTVNGGTTPLSWSVAAGTTPPGLTLDTGSGALTGTPTIEGSYAFTVAVLDALGQSATKAVTVVVVTGPLVVRKVADVSTTTAGSRVAYTITVANTGTTTRNGVDLQDSLGGVLDDATYGADAVANGGTLTYSADTLGWTGSIAPGETVTLTYSVRVAVAGTGNKTLANTAISSTLGTNCAAGSTDLRCSSSVTVSGLRIVKTADVASTTPGGTVRFQVVVTNTGPLPSSGAAFTDDLTGVLDDATYAADAAATTGDVAYSGSTLTWTGTLAAGAVATITYSVTVRAPDPGNRSLASTIVSASPGSSCPGGNPGASCTVTVPVLVPALVVTNVASVSSTPPSSTVIYTVRVSNTGQTPYVGAGVSVALGAALDDATYGGGATASTGQVGYAAGMLTWTGDLPTGAVATITYALTVSDPDPGDKVLSTLATSAAAGSTCPAAGPAAACTATVQVLVPGLAISTAASSATTTPGAVVTHTVVATNTGQTPYAAATVTASLAGVLDDAAYDADATATSGTVGWSSPTITWTGALAVGATVTVTYSVTVDRPDTGNRSLVTAVRSSAAGSTCPAATSDPRCGSTVSVLVPGLSFASSADATTTTPGSVVHYTETVSNTGETVQQAVVVVIDSRGVEDDATYDNDALVTAGSQVLNPDGTVSWTLSLAPGATATATVSFTVDDPDLGDRVLRTSISSDAAGSTCPTGSSGPGCTTTVSVLVPGLTLTKTASAPMMTPGETVSYTVSVVNDGQTTYPAATFADDLTDVLTDATYAGGATASSGALSYSSRVLSWTGALAPGDVATISYSVTASGSGTGDKHMTNAVVSTTTGSNCAPGSTDPRCLVAVHVAVPGLTVVTTADRATTAPGETVAHTVTVTNSGATAYPAATFASSLVGVLDDATLVAVPTATTGTATVSGSTITWTGALATGATASVTWTVVVHADDVGDDLLTPVVTSTTSGANCAAGSTDPRCTVTVPVARLVISSSTTSPTARPGGLVALPTTYTNTGRVPFTGITVQGFGQEAIDDAVPVGAQTASSGVLSVNATGTVWTGDLDLGVEVRLDATLRVLDPDTGDGLVHVYSESTAPGSNCPAGGSDPRCSVTVTVTVPGLSITKTASAPATVPGGTVGYTITVHNTGQTPYDAALVSDTLVGVLDDATYNANATASAGTVDYTSPVLSWTGDVAVGATVTITYSVTARTPDPGDKTMANPVSSSDAGSTCPPGGGATGCHTTVLVLTPALTIVKTADRATATLDSTVTYTVQVTNSGQTAHPAAAFSDSLAAVLDDATYQPGATATTSGTVGYTGGVLSWTGALAPGASATITYAVTVENPDPGDRSMANTVTSGTTGSNCAVGSGDPRCTATVAVTDSVSLTFHKTANAVATTAGATVVYTLTATSFSAEPMSADLTDPLGGVLDDATFNNDLTTVGGSPALYLAPDVTWSGSVPAASTVTVTYSVTVHPTVTGDQVLGGRLTSTLPGSSNNCLAASTDLRCVSTVPVAALLVQQAYTETSTTPGSLLHLSGTFTNTGAMPYVGITISSPSAGTVDDAVPTGDQTASSGNLVLSATAITWTGDIPAGGVVTVQGTLTVANPDTGDRLVTGTLVSSALGNNCPPGGVDARCTASVPVLLPALTLTKVASATTALPGATVGYTITVANAGQSGYTTATATDSLVGVLDDATYDGNVSATRGNAGISGSTLTWTGALEPGDTATVTYTVTVRDPEQGDKTMVNTVSSTDAGSTCPPAGGAASCRSTVAVLTPALTIVAVADTVTTVPGASATHTITATNTGQTTYPAAGLSVSLAGVLDDATYAGSTSTTGDLTLTAGALAWTGPLAPGAVVTITVTVTVDRPPTGDFRLAASVVSDVRGSNCPAAATDPRCATSVPVASLRLVNGANVVTTRPTGVVVNTVTFTNDGKVPYVGLVVNDSFLGSLDDATYNGDASATAGELLLVTGTGRVRWTGDLAPGASVTVTGSLTVNDPPAGNRNLSTVVTADVPGSSCPLAGGAPACSTSVPVLLPQLTITKTVDAAVTGPGDTVGYTITATNTGQTPYVSATINDPLAGVLNDASYGGGATATRGSVAYAASVLTWSGDLPVATSVTIHFTVQVQSPYRSDGVLVNRVVSDELGSTCPAGGTATACVATTTVLVPALEMAVTADRGSTVPGGTVGYTLTVRNAGQTVYDDASVDVSLLGVVDDATGPQGALASSGTLAQTVSTLTWTGDLLVGESATVTYDVTVAEPDPGDHTLLTSVSSSAPGSTCGSPGSCSSSVSVLVPGLAVSVAADVSTATPGDRATYTIILDNTGQTAYVGTTVSSSLAAVLDDAHLDGPVTASTGVASYAAPVVSWTGSLAPGAVATVRVAVVVDSPGNGDGTMPVVAVAPAQGSTCPSGSADSACTATVQVLVPALSITKTAGSPTTTPGSVVHYSILVANTGETAYDAAAVEDSLRGVLTDAAYNADAVVVGGGILSYTDATLRWTGALPVGASATISYSVTVSDPDPGDKELTNTVTSTSPGSTCPPVSPAAACTAEVRVLVPALVVTTSTSSATVVAGSPVTFTVTATNTGQTDYAPVTVTDVLSEALDDATYAGGATPSAGSVGYAGQALTWTLPLASGSTATLTYTVSAAFPATGDKSVTNAPRSSAPGSSCPTAAAAPACAVTVSVLVPALVVAKSVDTTSVAAGGTAHYTLTATNTGEADYAAVTLSDPLLGVLDDAAYGGDAVADRGTVSYTGGVLGWTGALAVGATVTMTFSATATLDGSGDGVLINRVTSTATGSTCAVDSVDPACVTATHVEASTLELTGLTGAFSLAGAPRSAASLDSAVSMTVTTNSPSGYDVTVLAQDGVLTGSAGNDDTIPLSLFGVRESGGEVWQTLSDVEPRLVHRQLTASVPGGDAVSNDYRVELPNVAPDTYSTTLDYLVTAR